MSAEDCLDLLSRPNWQVEAACRRPHNPQPDAWYPEEPDPDDEEEVELYWIKVEQAKLVCSNCPVREECEDDGKYEEYGIWGGLTRDERIEKYGTR